MKALLRWTIRNSPAMNTLMVGIMVVGALGLVLMHREVFPVFNLEIIQVTVPYLGASPEEVEEGICQKIEEAVRAIDGIKKISALAREGSGTVVLELEADVPDVQKVLNEVRSEVDRITTFPVLAEDPEVKQITLRTAAIRVGVIGPETDDPEAEVRLREVTERVREELLHLPSVSQVNILGAKDYQIDIEISEDTLRKYGLTLQQVGRIVRRENVELPGGTMKTDSQEVLLRGKDKHLVGEEIARIPLVTQPNGVVLTVGDLGVVRDEFADVTATTRINGKPGLVISVDKTASEDLLAIVDQVKGFIRSASEPGRYPWLEGYRLLPWADMSVMVKDRLDLLSKNGIQGLILVFLVLALFLDLRLAFWVALGVPVSILGACGVLYWGDQTLNMLSMFAFLMALGILVDDAIVIGENVYTHRQLGKGPVQAAVDGTYEVLPSVLASVTTTIVAFAPLLFVPGIMGKFIAIMPLAVIVMLIISLLESTFILPCHLAHGADRGSGRTKRGGFGRIYRSWTGLPLWSTIGLLLLALAVFAAHWKYPQPFPWEIRPWWRSAVAATAYAALVPAAVITLGLLMYPLKRLADLFGWLSAQSGRLLGAFIRRCYLPVLRWSLRNPAIVLSAALSFLLLAIGLILGGIVPFNAFPKLDVHVIIAEVVYPDGTPSSVTDRATRQLEQAIRDVDRKHARPGKPVVLVTHRSVGDMNVSGEITPMIKPVGSHAGAVGVELVETDQRSVTSAQIIAEWRRRAHELAGGFPGAESVTFRTTAVGPGGTPIEFKLLAAPERMQALEKAVESCKAKLREYPGVFDIADDSRPGKWEFQLKIKDRAKAMGIPLAELAETVRASYFGEEVMRLQRGRHEVKLMVRYPRQERRSLAKFDEIRVRTAPPVAELIRREVQRSLGGSRSLGQPSSMPSTPERPLTELANVEVRRGYSTITRQEQLRAITVTGDVDEARGNSREITNDLRDNFLPQLLAQPEYRGIRVRWEGMQEQTDESVAGLKRGLIIALIAMFALLTLKFRSYVQPVLVLLIIPFGAIGAIAGHWLMHLEVTLFSLFGLVALTGVVVNDSIVLIDFINRRVRDGIPLTESLLDAGRRRLRAVLCTSLTTIAGLFPLLLETSLQAQVLIPMAVSLCFGLMFTTVLVLVLVPVFYLVYAKLTMSETRVADAAPAAEAPPDAADRDREVEMLAG